MMAAPREICPPTDAANSTRLGALASMNAEARFDPAIVVAGSATIMSGTPPGVSARMLWITVAVAARAVVAS
jgi:hypothetical protein